MMPPRLPAEAMRTFEIAEPLATHWRSVRCEQAEGGCGAHANGWKTTCDLTTQLGLDQARYVRDHSGRRFVFEVSGGGTLVTFRFPAGQQCFAGHRVALGRPALFVVRNGDRRGPGRGRLARRLLAADQWTDTLHEATDRVADIARRG